MQLVGHVHRGDADAVRLQPAGVFDALVDQRVVAGGHDIGARHALQARGTQRAGLPFHAPRRIGRIEVDEPAHGLVGQDQILGEALVGRPFPRHVGGGIQQHLEADLRQRAVARHDRQHRRQVAAGAVAADRDAVRRRCGASSHSPPRSAAPRRSHRPPPGIRAPAPCGSRPRRRSSAPHWPARGTSGHGCRGRRSPSRRHAGTAGRAAGRSPRCRRRGSGAA